MVRRAYPVLQVRALPRLTLLVRGEQGRHRLLAGVMGKRCGEDVRQVQVTAEPLDERCIRGIVLDPAERCIGIEPLRRLTRPRQLSEGRHGGRANLRQPLHRRLGENLEIGAVKLTDQRSHGIRTPDLPEEHDEPERVVLVVVPPALQRLSERAGDA